MRPARSPITRGKCCSARSTACRLASRVLPRAAASRLSMAGEHRVHGRDRFVGEDQLGALVEHPGDADPLQLAAGKLVAALEQLVAEIQVLQCVVGAGAVQRIDQADQALP